MRLTSVVHDDVARFDVAVQYALQVSVMGCPRRRRYHPRDTGLQFMDRSLVRFRWRQAKFSSRDTAGEALAVNQFHGEKCVSVFLPYVVNPNNIRMLQTRSGFG